MSEPEIILDYKGTINFETIDPLLNRIKKHPSFRSLIKQVQKKLYSIVVECIENINNHSVPDLANYKNRLPYISLRKQCDKYIITAGNVISNENINKLRNKIEQINQLDKAGLKALYEDIINKKNVPGEKGAGLGLLTMALKSENRLDYNFFSISDKYSYFEISVYIMNNLIIEPTSTSPKVIFDYGRNLFEISGESRPEDVHKFYRPILQWLDDFGQDLSKQKDSNIPYEFNFNFEYFNSSSAKFILDFCKKLNTLRSAGNNIIVKWHYEEDDDDMHEVGHEMSRISKLPFEFIEIKL